MTLMSCLKKWIKELTNVSNWFNTNKLSLNFKRPSILFSTNHQKKIIIRCCFRILIINGLTVEHESSIKFLGICINENLTWRDHIHTAENKIAKNIVLLYQEKYYPDENYLKQIYFAYKHAYLNHANIAWTSTHKTKLKKKSKVNKNML